MTDDMPFIFVKGKRSGTMSTLRQLFAHSDDAVRLVATRNAIRRQHYKKWLTVSVHTTLAFRFLQRSVSAWILVQSIVTQDVMTKVTHTSEEYKDRRSSGMRNLQAARRS